MPVSSCQASIFCCAAITDDAAGINTIVFLLMGGGFLFGGIVITKSHVQHVFAWAYWLSVPGATTVQRN